MTYVDSLEVDLLLEHGVLGLFPDLNTEGDVGRLDDVTPEATDHDVVSRLLCLPGNKGAHSAVGHIV